MRAYRYKLFETLMVKGFRVILGASFQAGKMSQWKIERGLNYGLEFRTVSATLDHADMPAEKRTSGVNVWALGAPYKTKPGRRKPTFISNHSNREKAIAFTKQRWREACRDAKQPTLKVFDYTSQDLAEYELKVSPIDPAIQYRHQPSTPCSHCGNYRGVIWSAGVFEGRWACIDCVLSCGPEDVKKRPQPALVVAMTEPEELVAPWPFSGRLNALAGFWQNWDDSNHSGMSLVCDDPKFDLTSSQPCGPPVSLGSLIVQEDGGAVMEHRCTISKTYQPDDNKMFIDIRLIPGSSSEIPLTLIKEMGERLGDTPRRPTKIPPTQLILDIQCQYRKTT